MKLHRQSAFDRSVFPHMSAATPHRRLAPEPRWLAFVTLALGLAAILAVGWGFGG